MVARRFARLIQLPLLLLIPMALGAQPFVLPTANRALFEAGHEDSFFVGTVGKPWTSGCFGCVRSDGWQMHEGLDIRCLERDARGEPSDPVMAAADGVVAYINTKASLSNYGIYLMIRHSVEGMEVYSLYAHLSAVAPGLKKGQTVKAGEPVATMGRTTNTKESIAKDRAHVHFELVLPLNDRFPEWYRKTFPGQRNDHGVWNGQNMVGIDPKLVFVNSHEQAGRFSLLQFVRTRTELCRVLVRKTEFPWLKRYPALIRRNPVAEKEGVAGYELALNFNGLPFEAIPRAASEIQTKSRYQLLSVNEAEYRANPCRRLVTQKGGRWQLDNRGINLVELLIY